MKQRFGHRECQYFLYLLIKEVQGMKKIYFTLTGTRYYHGDSFLKPGMKVKLIKEPKNEVDHEAIRVELEGLGKIGYVANSPYTTIGESYSAGRLLDKLPKKYTGKVLYAMDKGVLCSLKIK